MDNQGIAIRRKVLDLLPDSKLVNLTGSTLPLSRTQMIEHIIWHWSKEKADAVRRYLERGLAPQSME